MERSYWLGNTRTAWTGKAAVSPTGHAVQKNYNRDDLREGDIGLTVRIDRERIHQMTPEQRLAAQAIAEEMMWDYLAALGKEVVEGSGIPVGTAIRIGKDEKTVISTIAPYLDYFTKRAVVGVLERETRIGMHLSCVSDDGATKTRLFMPFAEARDAGGIEIPDVPIERIAVERYLSARIENPLPGQFDWVSSGFDFDHNDVGTFAETWGTEGIYELLLVITPQKIWYRENSGECFPPPPEELLQKQHEKNASAIRYLKPLIRKLDIGHRGLLSQNAAFDSIRIVTTELLHGSDIPAEVKS